LVNDRPILRSDFMTQVQTQFGVPFAQSTQEQRARVLQDMLAEELLVQRGLEIDLPSFDPDVRAAMVAGVELEASANVLAQAPSDEQLRVYYRTHAGKYMTEGRLRLRDLVLRTGPAVSADQAMQTAVQAVRALRAGTSLEQAAIRFGLQDSGQLMQAGQIDTGEILEFAVKAKLGPELYAAVAALEGGRVSDPIRQRDGVHVVVMLEHKQPVQQEYNVVADQVWADYRSDALAQVRAANLRYLRRRATVMLSDDARALQGTGP
jgi:parvulin-like peptidyl-prolyl isomerase